MDEYRAAGGVWLTRWCCVAGLVVAMGSAVTASAQIPGQGGLGRPGRSQPSEELPSSPAEEKPDAAARKAYTAGMKSLTKAEDYESAAAGAANSDKKGAALEKMGDAYNRALDQFTEALSNKGDLVDAWNKVGYIHLRLGAYAESVDDYNHTLALKPDLREAVLHRAEAYLAIDRLDDAKSAYMDLYNHVPPMAEELFTAMQAWLTAHRSNLNGMRPADVESFDKWLTERSLAKQAAALPH